MLGETDTFSVSNNADSTIFEAVVGGFLDVAVEANDDSVVDDIVVMTGFIVAVVVAASL